MPAKFILTIHLYKEGRTNAQFFPDEASASEHARTLQDTFACDTYVSEIKSVRYGKR